MSSNRRGRRVPPKSRGIRPDIPPVIPPAADPSAAGASEPTTPVTGTRAANRAAKRATMGVRPKTVRRGHVVNRQTRRYNPALLGLALAAVLVGAGVLLLGNPFGSPAASPTAAVYGDGTCPTTQPAVMPTGESRIVTIETSLGDIVIRVDGALSPIATGNFVALAECEYYDGVVFHRLAPGFVIQGGDPDGTGSGPGPGYGIQDEPITGTYRRGTVAMARTTQANSQGSQFFIVLADAAATALTNVDPARGYAILGEVVSGMDVVDTIAAMPNSGEQGGNAALEPIAMTKVTVSDAPASSASPGASATAPSATPAASPATTP